MKLNQRVVKVIDDEELVINHKMFCTMKDGTPYAIHMRVDIESNPYICKDEAMKDKIIYNTSVVIPFLTVTLDFLTFIFIV